MILEAFNGFVKELGVRKGFGTEPAAHLGPSSIGSFSEACVYLKTAFLSLFIHILATKQPTFDAFSLRIV